MSQLFKNTIIALSGNGINAIANMLLVFYMTREYGLEFYGEFVLLQTFVMILFILTKLNIWQSFVAYYYSQTHKTRVIQRYFIYDILFSGLSFVLCFIFFIFFYDILFATIASLFVCFYSNGFVVGLWRSIKKFNYYAIALNFCAFTKLTLLILFEYESSYNCFIILMVADLLIWLSIWTVVVVFHKKIVFRKFKSYVIVISSGKFFIKELKFIFGCYLSSLIDLPVSHLDKVILSIFLNPYYIGVYSLIRRICQLISTVTEPITHVLYSEFNSLLNEKKINKIDFISKIFSFSIIFLGGCIILAAHFLFEALNSIIFKNQLNGQESLLLLGLSIQVIGLSFSWLNPFVLAVGKINLSNVIALKSNLLYLIALFLGTYCFGIIAAFISLLIQYISIAYLKYRIYSDFKKELYI